MRGETSLYQTIRYPRPISIHSPHARGDLCRRAHLHQRVISIHSPHARGDLCWPASSPRRRSISIHSPHARGDDIRPPEPCLNADFNPLPSCEGRLPGGVPTVCLHRFQSTPLMRGETFLASHRFCSFVFQSTPLMRGETVNIPLYLSPCSPISIHSPHARGDADDHRKGYVVCISIHSPHARGDVGTIPSLPISKNFNPLPSCEGRRIEGHVSPWAIIISIHSPHARGDVGCSVVRAGTLFQSTPLMRGETQAVVYTPH